MTEKLRIKERNSRSPTTSLTGRSCSKDQPKSPCSRPWNFPSLGHRPTQTAYCSRNGLSRPYCLRRKSTFSSAALSPWLFSSAIWLERESPGAGLVAGLVPLAELRPLQLQLAGRRQLVGAGLGCRQAVLEAAPHRHHRLAGEDAVAESLALRRLAEHGDPDFGPGLAHQLQHVGLLRALARGLDDDLQLAAVGQAADAIEAALQAHLVEQPVGRLAVVARPGVPVALAVERAAGEHG